MELLDNYLDAKRKFLDFFDYEEGWRLLPIVDERSSFWDYLNNSIKWADSDSELQSEEGYCFSGLIYRPGNPPGIWESGEYTLVAVDTMCDGNIFLAVFDNTKRRSCHGLN